MKRLLNALDRLNCWQWWLFWFGLCTFLAGVDVDREQWGAAAWQVALATMYGWFLVARIRDGQRVLDAIGNLPVGKHSITVTRVPR